MNYTLRSSNYELREKLNDWRKACDVLASMQRLEYLHITVQFDPYCPSHGEPRAYPNDYVDVLQPLVDLRAETFTVVLTPPCPESARERMPAVLPFRILRTDGQPRSV